ncbi:MAG TPA: hypothetical protein VHV78_10920, partial [Gemmatimonadaceae bacterium]|nr:hypothetical protein [Gemmatimonadaceae bacterium]
MSGDHDHGDVDRREFLRLAGASIALAGLDGCTRMPAEHILPYVDNRPELTPGVAQYYATAMCVDGVATGLIVEAHDGRPTKVEGNPDHPASLGASGAIEQASVLQLYDPDRATHARVNRAAAGWSTVANMLSPAVLGARVGARGKGLRFLIEPTSSPLDEDMLSRVLDRYPDACVHMYAPLVADRASTPVVTQYDLGLADVVLAVGSDCLASGPFHLRHARRFADRRRLSQPTDSMNRLYAIESSFTPTGSAADHRFAARPSDIPALMRSLLAAVSDIPASHSAAGQSGSSQSASTQSLSPPPWVSAIARDLRENAGRALVIVGDGQPASVHAAGDAINAAVRATGRTTWRTPSPLIGSRVAIHPFTELVDAIGAGGGDVDTLIIVGGNPSYATPGILEFSSLVRRVATVGYVGLYENETARDASWFVPLSH